MTHGYGAVLVRGTSVGDGTSGQQLLDSAVEALNRNDLSRAQPLFEHLRLLYPRSAAPLIGLAQIALRQKQYSKAEAYLLQAVGHEPALPETWKSLVILYNERQDRTRLRWALEMWRTVEPNNPQAVALLLVLYEQTGDTQAYRKLRAEWERLNPNVPLPQLKMQTRIRHEDLPRLIQQNPNSPELRKAYVAVLFQRKQYRQAIPHLERLMRLQPKESSHAYHLAYCWVQLGEFERARVAILEARRRGEPRARSARLLAFILLQLDRPAEALPELEWLYQQKPNDGELARAYALTLMRLEQHSKAVAPLRKWLQSEPKSATAWYLLGIAYALSGQASQALEPLQRAVALEPSSTLMRYHRAIILAQAEKPQEARQALEALLREPQTAKQPLYPEIGRALLNLLRQQKAWDACEEWLRRLQQEQPNSPTWVYERALTLMAQERYDDLRLYLEEQIPKASADAKRDLWILMTESYLGEGKTDLALQTAERALPEPEPLLNLARMFARQGQHERAITQLQRLQNASLSPAQRQEVEIRLAKLLAKTGKTDSAIQLLRASLQQNPKDEERAIALALILTDLNHPSARSAWEAVVAIQPRHLEARVRLALSGDTSTLWTLLPELIQHLHRQQVELVQAIQQSGGAIDLFWLMEAGEPANRLNTLLQSALQALWREARTPTQQNTTLERLSALVRKHPESQMLMEFVLERYLQIGQPQHALAVLEEVIRQYPTNAWLYYRKGQILAQTGKKEEAREAFLQCLRLDPRRSEARKAMESLSAD